MTYNKYTSNNSENKYTSNNSYNNSEEVFAFGAIGFILGLVIMFFFAWAVIAGSSGPYVQCNEDEVYAWQMDYRPVYGESEWRCVSIDDLIGATNGK